MRASVESAGSLVLWRMAIKPGRPVAMGVIAGTPFIGLPGNPVASFVTFAYVVRPTLLALIRRLARTACGAAGARRLFLPEKEGAARICARQPAPVRRGRIWEATKFPREGAGLLSSLADTDGLVELGENVERVSPGDNVGFLAYASLI